MTNIYDQHSIAFKNVAAYVITDSTGERVATVAFKHGQAVTCYLHIIGLQMTHGRAGGGGYDRQSAAAYDAVMKAGCGAMHSEEAAQYAPILENFKEALKSGNGSSHWDRALIEAGFRVMQAV